jgi:sulfide dehydrogenase cytochrome subunit
VRRLLVLIMLIGSGQAAAQAGDSGLELRGRVLASSCSGCHRAGPARPEGIPDLAGLGTDEIAQKLRAYRSGEAAATLMNRLARGYSEEEIDLLARTLGEEGEP